jgi:hypothetical protein
MQFDAWQDSYRVHINACVIRGHIGVFSNETHISNCSFVGTNVGIQAAGNGLLIQANRFEVNGTAILLGKAPDGKDFAINGAVVMANTFESNNIAIDINAVSGGFITGNMIQGFDNAGPGGSDPQYGILFRRGQFCTISNGFVSGFFTQAGVRCGIAGQGSGGCLFERFSSTVGGGVNWMMPPAGFNFRFVDCNNP